MTTTASKAATLKLKEVETLEALILGMLSASEDGVLRVTLENKFVGFVVEENSLTHELRVVGMSIDQMAKLMFAVSPTEGSA